MATTEKLTSQPSSTTGGGRWEEWEEGGEGGVGGREGEYQYIHVCFVGVCDIVAL